MLTNWIKKSRVESFKANVPFEPTWKQGNALFPEEKKKMDDDIHKKRSKRRKKNSVGHARIGTFFNTLEYILQALRMASCLPLTIDKEFNTVEFRICSMSFAFTVITFSAWSAVVWIVVGERFQILVESSDSFDDSVVAYVYIIYFMEWPILPLIRWFWQTPKLLTFISKWRNFEDQFHLVTGAPLELNQEMSRSLVAVVAASVPLLTLLGGVASHYIMPIMRSMHLAAYWIIATQMYLNSAFVWATSKALQVASKGLVHGLRRDASASARADAGSVFEDPSTRHWPQEYMELWRKLSLMVRYSGSGAIGPAFILNIGKEFPAMLLAAYGVIAWLDGGTHGNEIGVLLILIHHLADLIFLGNSAHNAAHSAGSDIRDELSLMMVKPRTSHKVKKEIHEFLQLMDASPPYITAGGYVILDKEFVSKLLGTMVTYLVVLLQFRHAMHAPTIPWIYHPTSNTSTTTNGLEMGSISSTDSYKV